MPLLVLRVPLVSADNVSILARHVLPPAAEHSDGLLFDGLALGHGDDVNNKAKADNDDDAPTEKLEWLRSQIIGAEAEFASPFGTRRITYADHTASGRCLRFVEEFVTRNVLPFYGPYAHRLLGISSARAKAIRSAVEQGYHGVRPGWTRVSLAYYTSTQEAEFVLDAVAFVASFGHRFLPLYTFDWKAGDWHYDHSGGRGLVPNNVGSPGGQVKAENGYQSYMAFAHCLAESYHLQWAQ